jgi:hypothetical protein
MRIQYLRNILTVINCLRSVSRPLRGSVAQSDFVFCAFRLHALAVQESLPAAALQEDRRSRSLVTEREEPRLCHHLPDSFHPSEVHAQIRHAAARLQRSPLHIRRRARCRNAQGIYFWCLRG